MEVLLPVRYIKVVIAFLIIAAVARKGARVVRLSDDEVGVAVLHGFVISMIQRHWILMVDVKVRRILIQEESAGAPRWQCNRVLQVSVVLHVCRPEDGVTGSGLGQGHFVAKQWIREEIEVIAVRRFVFDAAVTFVSIQVDQVRIVLAIVVAVSRTRVALLEELWHVRGLHDF